MTVIEKQEIDDYPIKAHRRSIYEFKTPTGDIFHDRFALVISNEDRACDRMVNILIISLKESVGKDLIQVQLGDGRTGYIHCGLLTYCKRTLLGECVGSVSKAVMSRINKMVRVELGLSNRGEKPLENDPDYERMYKDLLKMMISGGGVN